MGIECFGAEGIACRRRGAYGTSLEGLGAYDLRNMELQGAYGAPAAQGIIGLSGLKLES